MSMVYVFIMLVYLGGIYRAPKKWGWWQILCWPCLLGAYLVTKCQPWDAE